VRAVVAAGIGLEPQVSDGLELFLSLQDQVVSFAGRHQGLRPRPLEKQFLRQTKPPLYVPRENRVKEQRPAKQTRCARAKGIADLNNDASAARFPVRHGGRLC
jgi:hypothetical protein